MLLELIVIASAALHGRSLRDPIDPLEQMRERLHIVVGESGESVAFHPRPSADISDGVFALAFSGQVVPRFARVLARQMDFEHAVYAQGFVLEALDGVYLRFRVLLAGTIQSQPIDQNERGRKKEWG